MSNVTTLPVGPSAGEPLALPGGVRRTPFYFASQRHGLFGWLHSPERASHFDHGVVICPPLGHEQVHAHRGLRHLADAVAAAGLPVVRFDYHGTGDSSGSGEEPERVAVWLANIRDACCWLKDHLGCTRISLIGLRLGAALAARVAADIEVDGLLLWAPVVKGRSYVREMKALSATATSSPKSSGEIEAAGFALTEQTVQELSRLDLLQCRPRCRRALIVTRDDLPSDSHLFEHLKQLGIDARQSAQPGYADMMAEPHYTKVPQQAIAHGVDWLLAGIDGATTNALANIAIEALQCSADGALRLDQGIREQVLVISQEPNLFGILSEPANAARADLPIIVMINAGSCYRIGPNRLHVSLARQLALQGFRSVRMDLCGLGDSVAPASQRENDSYPATAFRDIDVTLKYLRTHHGAQRGVLLGLCSGAYTAFQSAAQLSSPVLVESVLINPLTFYWREGMSLEACPALLQKSFQECMTSVWQPRKWLKFLSGRSKIGVTGAMKLLAQRWRRRPVRDQRVAVDACEAAPSNAPSHPLHEDLPGDLDRVAKAGRRLACFFARSDPGYGILMHHARRKVDKLRRAGTLNVDFVENADHTFSQRAARRALEEAIAEHLVRRYR